MVSTHPLLAGTQRNKLQAAIERSAELTLRLETRRWNTTASGGLGNSVIFEPFRSHHVRSRGLGPLKEHVDP